MTLPESAKPYYPSYCVPDPELTPRRINLIQSSFASVADGTAPGLAGGGIGAFGKLFYENLFATYPSVRELFKNPEQPHALTAMLRKATNLLDKDLNAVVEDLGELARRHQAYGAKPGHYAAVGENLVKSLTQALQDRMDGETKEAWIHLYSLMVKIMLPITCELVEAADEL